jgi:hypothetical protein
MATIAAHYAAEADYVAYRLCPRDGDDPERDRLIDRSDSLLGEAIELVKQIMNIPATSHAGLFAKLHVAWDEWPKTRRSEEGELYEDVTRSALLDAVRMAGVTA